MNSDMNSDRPTGTQDEHFDLISVLYHSLEAAATYEIYCRDAEQTGDTELYRFFREIQQQENSRATKAKELLAPRLTQSARRHSDLRALSVDELGA